MFCIFIGLTVFHDVLQNKFGENSSWDTNENK